MSFNRLNTVSLAIFLVILLIREGENVDFSDYLEANDCFEFERKLNSKCSFYISNKINITTECIKSPSIILNNSFNVLRVVGDFDVIKIVCSAKYPIDLIYYGVQPNEAIFGEWFKNVTKGTFGQNFDYVIEAKIYSVNSLFNYYNDPKNGLFENKNDGLPLQNKIDYPRSGNYTFPGIYNHSISTSFYMLLEDGSKPEFLRNKRTVAHVKDSNLIIPCISSHFKTNVKIELPDSVQSKSSILKISNLEGVVIPIETSDNITGIYKCSLLLDGVEVDSLSLTYIDESTPSYLYGLFDQSNTGLNEIEVLTYDKDNKLTHTALNPVCKISTFKDEPNKFLSYIPAPNFSFMRLRQQFALPEFINRSYTGRKTEEWDPLLRELRVWNRTTEKMGTVYCRYGQSITTKDFGASVTVFVAVNFGFGKDWADPKEFDRTKTPLNIHYLLKQITEGELIAGTFVKFECKINIPVISKPVIWYTRRKNGSLIEEMIDYDLIRDVSVFNKKLTIDVDEIFCSGSYWYTEVWRNISQPLTLHQGISPSIASDLRKYTFTRGSGTGFTTVSCTTGGKPLPKAYFMKDGQNISEKTWSSGNKHTLEIEINKARRETYECVAENEFGISVSKFDVWIEDEGGINLWLAVLIPIAVFIFTLIGAYIYIRFFRPEKTGLTKDEIEEFIKGLQEGELGSNKGEYAHDFAHLCPYTGEYEIPAARFKIDLDHVIGSGAFGMVLKGVVDNDEVAVKTIKRNADKQYLKALLSELKIMIYLGNHPHLIHIIGAYTKELAKGTVYVFVKYLPHGSLENYLRKYKSYFVGSQNNQSNYMNTVANRLDANSFGVDDLVRWSAELADGMDYLSSKKVIHGDLAARNLLLDSNRTIRITDFGLSRQLYDYSDYVKKQLEPLPWRWMALESLKYLSFSTASDVWGFGITIWEIFSIGEVPYPGYSWNLEFVELLENGLRMSRPKHASNLVYALMTQCWNSTPEKRPNFKSIKESLEEVLLKEIQQQRE